MPSQYKILEMQRLSRLRHGGCVVLWGAALFAGEKYRLFHWRSAFRFSYRQYGGNNAEKIWNAIRHAWLPSFGGNISRRIQTSLRRRFYFKIRRKIKAVYRKEAGYKNNGRFQAFPSRNACFQLYSQRNSRFWRRLTPFFIDKSILLWYNLFRCENGGIYGEVSKWS